jgi:hypothetical protein
VAKSQTILGTLHVCGRCLSEKLVGSRMLIISPTMMLGIGAQHASRSCDGKSKSKRVSNCRCWMLKRTRIREIWTE